MFIQCNRNGFVPSGSIGNRYCHCISLPNENLRNFVFTYLHNSRWGFCGVLYHKKYNFSIDLLPVMIGDSCFGSCFDEISGKNDITPQTSYVKISVLRFSQFPGILYAGTVFLHIYCFINT